MAAAMHWYKSVSEKQRYSWMTHSFILFSWEFWGQGWVSGIYTCLRKCNDVLWCCKLPKIFKQLIDFGNPTADNKPKVKSEDVRRGSMSAFMWWIFFLFFISSKVRWFLNIGIMIVLLAFRTLHFLAFEEG